MIEKNYVFSSKIIEIINFQKNLNRWHQCFWASANDRITSRCSKMLKYNASLLSKWFMADLQNKTNKFKCFQKMKLWESQTVHLFYFIQSSNEVNQYIPAYLRCRGGPQNCLRQTNNRTICNLGPPVNCQSVTGGKARRVSHGIKLI